MPSLDQLVERLTATGITAFQAYQNSPASGRVAEVKYGGDVRFLVAFFGGDVMKIDDDRVGRGFNDFEPPLIAAWVELNAQQPTATRPPMPAERIAELTSRETP